MQSRKPPFKFVGPGKVFRCERTDATHEMCFHQLEGMMVGKDITVGNLIYFMKTLLKEIFQKDMEVRLRPGYFPFVEPGFELDIRWKKPGKGESKHSGWLSCYLVEWFILMFYEQVELTQKNTMGLPLDLVSIVWLWSNI